MPLSSVPLCIPSLLPVDDGDEDNDGDDLGFEEAVRKLA